MKLNILSKRRKKINQNRFQLKVRWLRTKIVFLPLFSILFDLFVDRMIKKYGILSEVR